ncbi:MAG: hypothetical protein ABIA11_03460 [Patescibacteria group bacterium]
MKKIIKNSILVFVLMVGMLGVGASFVSAAGPTVNDAGAESVTQTTAVLTGVVSANGTTANAWFQNSIGATLSGSGLNGITTDNVPMPSYSISGLTPNTSYTYTLVITDGPNIHTQNINFTTDPAPEPTVDNAGAESVTQTTAVLTGTVSANGTTANAWFQAPGGTTLPGSGLNGITTNNVSMPSYSLSGLSPFTTYTYKLVITDGPHMDTQNITFTTLPNNGSGCSVYPSISSLSPDNINEGSGDTTITITGANFIVTGFEAPTQARANGLNRTTTVISSISLTMILTSSDLASDGTITISVTNGGCDSGTLPFTVNDIGIDPPPPPGGGGGGGGGSNIESPTVVTLNATGVNNISATLNGTVDPNDHYTTAWFEYSTSSTFLTSTTTTHTVKGDGDVAVAMTANLTNLSPNTIYYFRAVGENNHGIKRGDIKSFSTSEPTTGLITTIQATNQYSTSAKLNALFVNQNGSSAKGWFEYGKTVNLGSKTAEINLGTSATKTFSSTTTNLTPYTIYYFRAMAKKDGNTYTGKILVFRTQKAVIPATPTTEVIPVVEPIQEVDIESSILEITTAKESIEIGKEVEYLVSFENNSLVNFEKTFITVQLPEIIDFIASDLGREGENNIVTFDAGTLVPSQTGSIKIVGLVNSKAIEQNIFVTTAIMSYTPTDLGYQKDEIAFVSNKVIGSDDSNLGAASIFGNGSFFPSSIISWITLLLIALGFVIVGRNLYAIYADKKKKGKYDYETEYRNIDLDNLPKH